MSRRDAVDISFSRAEQCRSCKAVVNLNVDRFHFLSHISTGDKDKDGKSHDFPEVMTDLPAGENAGSRNQNSGEGIMWRDVGAYRQTVDPEQLDQGADQQTGIRIAEEEPHQGSGDHGSGDHALNHDPVKTDQTSQ